MSKLQKYQILSWCAKNLEFFLTKFKNGDLGLKPVNLREFRKAEKHKLIEKLDYYFGSINWFLDLTSRSVVTLKSHKTRKGKFREKGYIVLYNLRFRFGYAIAQDSYRNIRKEKLIELLRISRVNDIIATDKRHSDIPNIITVPKKFTRRLDALFGFKNGLYKRLNEVKDEHDLDELYKEYFNRLGIMVIED